MDISVKLKNGEEIRLKPIRKSDKDGEEMYDLIKSGGHKPLIVLKLNPDSKKFDVVSMDEQILDSDDMLNSKLDDLFLEIVESQQSGAEDNETDNHDIDKPYNPESIRVEPKSFSLRQIYDMINDEDIDISPDFQRNFVWDNFRKSRLIESILLRIPLPVFYFSQDKDGKLTVVDGLQRLNTIKEFMDNNHKLKDLEYLEVCNNKFYGKEPFIEPKYFRWFNMTQIIVNIIDPSSPSAVKYDIFRRLNTGGKPLNAQEVRNCLSNRKVRETLRKMVSTDSFKEATDGSVKDIRMQAQELALRFIYFYEKYIEDDTLDNYNGKIDIELDSLNDKISNDKSFDSSKYVDLFDKAMKNAYYLFGRFAFRKNTIDLLKPSAPKQLINKALFVSWSVLLCKYDVEIIKKLNEPCCLAKPLAEKITSDNDLFLYLSYSTNSKANIQASFAAASEIITKNLLLS